MKIYHGKRFGNSPIDEVQVYVVEDGVENRLKLRLDLKNHSPTGFSWGYLGSGPSQLALAILADFKDDKLALKFYMEFKLAFLSKFGNEWSMTGIEIDSWLKQVQKATFDGCEIDNNPERGLTV